MERMRMLRLFAAAVSLAGTAPMIRAGISASLRGIVAGRNRCMPALPDEVRAERGDMTRHPIVHTAAERERALAEGRPTPRAGWQEAADSLVDAIVGMWLAPPGGV